MQVLYMYACVCVFMCVCACMCVCIICIRLAWGAAQGNKREVAEGQEVIHAHTHTHTRTLKHTHDVYIQGWPGVQNKEANEKMLKAKKLDLEAQLAAISLELQK